MLFVASVVRRGLRCLSPACVVDPGFSQRPFCSPLWVCLDGHILSTNSTSRLRKTLLVGRGSVIGRTTEILPGECPQEGRVSFRICSRKTNESHAGGQLVHIEKISSGAQSDFRCALERKSIRTGADAREGNALNSVL